MMKSRDKLILGIGILWILILTAIGCYKPLTVNAAENTPYGYTYDDAATYKTVYKYYAWSQTKNSYGLAREFYSKGTYVYFGSGTLICNDSISNGAKYNGFDEEGNFFIITKNHALIKVSTTNKVTTLVESGVTRLNYNSDDLAYSVTTTGGAVYLSNLKPAPDTDNDDTYTEPVVVKNANRVDIYTNSANETVYEAYKNGNIKTQLVVSANGANVLNATAKVRLTDTLKGAKFLGFDTNYNVYLYEKGILYRFRDNKWYSAEKLNLSGTYKSYKKDDNGFITKIVTNKTSYTMKQLTTSGKWKASKTYVVKKSGYQTLYVKGSATSNTLALKSGVLTLNGKKIASGVSKYGFTKSKKIIFLKKGAVYTAKLSKPAYVSKFCTKGKTFKTNSLGLVTKVVRTKGIKKVA
ncbi:hypothetical protein IJ425_01050 [bacterium]|nr:hypothetical protein [bacterium]